MNNHQGRKRYTIFFENPNPLFERWLTDLYNSAVEKGLPKQHSYKKALRSLQKYPLPLSSAKECLVLENFGQDMKNYLEWKLQRYKSNPVVESGIQAPIPTVVQNAQSQVPSSQKRSGSKGTPKKNQDKAARAKRKSDQYVPAYRSGPYAFLITLLSHEGRPNFAGYLTKAELLKEAQPLCDASLTKPVPGSRYTAWSSMTSVTNKGLISRTGNPARFSLTAEGREMAVKLLHADATASNQPATTSNQPVSDDDELTSPPWTSKPMSPYKNSPIKASQSSSAAVPHKRAQTKKTTREESPPPCSQDFVDTYVPIAMQPGSFDVVLLVDTSETTGNSSGARKTKEILEGHQLNFEVRRLKVGDFSWVARDNVTNKELLLPFIVERKRMDDLGSSIKDGRFHEQKFRLKLCGITNLIYLVENYGNNEHLGLPLASVQQAAVNTRVVDGFQVKYTNDHAHSMMYLAAMTQTLRTIYKDKTLVSSRKSDLAEKDVGPEADVAFLITYDEFNKSSSKIRNFTIREMLIRQLLQLHGLSVEKAIAIAERYPTPKALMNAFESSGEDLLTTVPFGANNKKLGPLISKALHRLYTARTLS